MVFAVWSYKSTMALEVFLSPSQPVCLCPLRLWAFFFSLLSQLTCVRLQDTACKTQPRGAGRDSGWATGQPRAHSSAPQPALPRSPSGIPPTHLPAGQDGETNEKGVWALTLGSGVHLGGLVHLLRPPFGRATCGAKSVAPLLWSDSSLRAC